MTLYFWQPLGPLTGRITAQWTPKCLSLSVCLSPVSLDISHSSAVQFTLLFYSSFILLQIPRHSLSLYFLCPPCSLLILGTPLWLHHVPLPDIWFLLHLSTCPLSFPLLSPSLSFCLARKSSFPPWVQQTPVWVSEEKWPAPLEPRLRKISPPSPPRTDSCMSR